MVPSFELVAVEMTRVVRGVVAAPARSGRAPGGPRVRSAPGPPPPFALRVFASSGGSPRRRVRRGMYGRRRGRDWRQTRSIRRLDTPFVTGGRCYPERLASRMAKMHRGLPNLSLRSRQRGRTSSRSGDERGDPRRCRGAPRAPRRSARRRRLDLHERAPRGGRPPRARGVHHQPARAGGPRGADAADGCGQPGIRPASAASMASSPNRLRTRSSRYGALVSSLPPSMPML